MKLDWGKETIYRASTNSGARFEIRTAPRGGWFLLVYREEFRSERLVHKAEFSRLADAKAEAESMPF